MGDSLPRADAHEDSIAVMLPIPADVAAQFPDTGENGEPHVTMVYVGGADETAVDAIKAIVADEASAIIGETIALGAPDYFDGPKGRAVFARVIVPEVVRAARDRIALRIADAGIDVGHIPLDARMDAVTDHGPWIPHATLAYLAPGEDFTSETPTGEWTIDNVQVWHGDERHNIGGPERTDMGPDPRVTGHARAITYEMDASERLRQIEAAKAAKDAAPEDAPRADQAQIELFRPMVAGLVAEAMASFPAPAVHTESRLCEWVMRSDQATVLTPDIKVDGAWRQDDGLLPQETLTNGWRRYPVLYSKAGNVQTYVINGQEIREWRDPAAVFDRASMDTGVGIPWELRHSPKLLTPDTVRGVARGVVMSVDPHSDGVHTAGHAIAWDRGLWTAISTDAPEVSVANNVKIDPRPGTTDDGQKFHARQVGFIWNSFASEPKGNAGTARVLTADDRLDAALVVHRADDLLEIGRGLGRDPSYSPVYYDLREWERHDSATPPTAPEPRKDIDTMEELLKALKGVDPAALATLLGVDEEAIAAMLAAEPVADADAPPPAADDEEKPPEDAPPREDAETVALMIEGREFMVDPAVSAAFALLAEKVSINGDRADRLEIDLKAAKVDVQSRKDAADDMIPRADAVQMATDKALEVGSLIALAQSVNGRDADGNAWTPVPRQDAEGSALPVTVQDWAYGALTGAYGDKAPNIIERLDAASDAERPGLIKMRLGDAREIIAERSDHSASAVDAVNRARNHHAETRRKDSAEPGPIAAAKAKQAEAGMNYKGSSAQNGAT